MRKINEDNHFQALIDSKQRIEHRRIIMPFIIFALLGIFLYTYAVYELIISLIVLLTILLIVVFHYLYDRQLAEQVNKLYLEMQSYFQTHMVPKLWSKAEATMLVNDHLNIDRMILESIPLFNDYLSYNSCFHFQLHLPNDQKLVFDEVILSNHVDEDL